MKFLLLTYDPQGTSGPDVIPGRVEGWRGAP